MIKAIVFDFDGVIVRRSEIFKTEAWEEIFPPGTPERDSFLVAEERHGRGRGGDRFDIIRHVLTIKGDKGEALEDQVSRTAKRFDELVQKKILEAGVETKDRLMLIELARTHSLYLNSATPVEALWRTVQNLGLDSIFTFERVLGRPHSKIENFKFATTQENISPQEMLFVGDSDTDFKAAQEFGSAFIGLANESNHWQEGEKEFSVVTDFAEIKKVIADKPGEDIESLN